MSLPSPALVAGSTEGAVVGWGGWVIPQRQVANGWRFSPSPIRKMHMMHFEQGLRKVAKVVVESGIRIGRGGWGTPEMANRGSGGRREDGGGTASIISTRSCVVSAEAREEGSPGPALGSQQKDRVSSRGCRGHCAHLDHRELQPLRRRCGNEPDTGFSLPPSWTSSIPLARDGNGIHSKTEDQAVWERLSAGVLEPATGAHVRLKGTGQR